MAPGSDHDEVSRVRTLLAALDLQDGELRVVRRGERATTVRLDRADGQRFSVRLALPGHEPALHRLARLHHAFRTAGVDVPAALHDHPLEVDGLYGLVTQWVSFTNERVTMTDVGRILRRVHDGVSIEAVGAPAASRRTAFFHDLATNTSWQQADRHPFQDSRTFREFVNHCDDTFAAYEAHDRDHVVAHGDWKPGNVHATAAGQPVVLDLEYAGLAPRGIDFGYTAMAVHHGLWPRIAYEQLASGYGEGAPSLQAAAPFRKLMELWWIRHAADASVTSEFGKREFSLRWHSLREDDPAAPWHYYASDTGPRATWRIGADGLSL